MARWLVIAGVLIDALIAATGRLRDGNQPEFDPELIELFGEIAGDAALEPAFRALALTLPGESDIAREIGNDIDPDAIHAAREAMIHRIGTAHLADLRRLMQENEAEEGEFSPDADSAGRRAFCNALSDYISAATGDASLVAARYRGARNMTDRMAAMSVLAHRFAGSAETVAALADFEQRFRNDGMVLDKWFQVQASTPGPEAISTIEALTGHPGFSYTNPNRVRALFGTFAMANQIGFHRSDGKGYQLFADAILTIERFNPQVAARLATDFRSWRSLEAVRRELAQAALERIRKEGTGSPDLTDIIDRTLA